VTTLRHLVSQAAGLAGAHPCVTFGHAWKCSGGRPCPHYDTDLDCRGSQSVYECERCGYVDYGEPGGLGDNDCNPPCSKRAEERKA
jgi:hypothetical protein